MLGLTPATPERIFAEKRISVVETAGWSRKKHSDIARDRYRSLLVAIAYQQRA
jgi:hypothetical protein